MDRTELHKGFEIRAYEREPQRWRAEIRVLFYLNDVHGGAQHLISVRQQIIETLMRETYIYGHLPFDGTTQANDVFYRCEHWLTSRRVLLSTGDILAGTYGFPESDLPFVPTGFAAVGRYALPNLPPACRRYEIRPSAGYKLKCGAAVPLYGQAGGGVEVMFPNKFTNNVVPIPAPTVLQPL